jgi:hypothetical protein
MLEHLHFRFEPPTEVLPLIPLEVALAILVWWVISDIGLPRREKSPLLPFVIEGYLAISVVIGLGLLVR